MYHTLAVEDAELKSCDVVLAKRGEQGYLIPTEDAGSRYGSIRSCAAGHLADTGASDLFTGRWEVFDQAKSIPVDGAADEDLCQPS